MGTTPISEKKIEQLLKLIANGTDDKLIAEILSITPNSVNKYKRLYSCINAEQPLKASYFDNYPRAIAIIERITEKKAIKETAVVQVETMVEKTDTAQENSENVKTEPLKSVKTPDNSLLAVGTIIRSLGEIDEHIGQLMDADLPRHVERLATAIEAGNITVDTESIVKAIESAQNALSTSIRITIKECLTDFLNIQKENRNTLTAIKNSVQRMENRKK